MAKTGYHRADRVADQIRMEVADILMRKIKDPRVQSVTVTDVKLTSDLRIARVFVTAMGTEDEERNVFAGLAQANGFVRGELGVGFRFGICRRSSLPRMSVGLEVTAC